MRRLFNQNHIHIRSAAVLLSLVIALGLFLVCPDIPGTALRAETSVWDYGYSGVCTTAGQIDAAFPGSYATSLKKLLRAHPNWRFRAFYTGLSWEECFAHDDAYSTNTEMYKTRNLIELGYKPDSWYSTEIPGCFNWAANSYTVISAPNWVQASEEAIRYCMDPRNWMSEEQIFQFMDQTAPTTLLAVQQVFAQTGSGFWTRSGENADLYWEEEVSVPQVQASGKDSGAPEGDADVRTVTVRHYLTYAEALDRIGRELGVSPVALATRIVNEQGIGNSPLISGTRAFTLENGQVIDGGYYNYFNMGATDGEEGASMERIITNGLREAYEGNWDTRYKALYGGASKYAATYIHRGQNTIYQQKYSVDSNSYYLFWHQYMQAILAPAIAARDAYNSYRSTGILDDAIQFLIPVYNRMPDAPEPEPVKDGNPNYKLGGIYADGSSVPDFDTDVLSYTVETSEDSLHLYVLAYADTSVISAAGASGTGSLSTDIPLKPGLNSVTIVCTAQNGDARTYTLSVVCNDPQVTYGDVNSDGVISAMDLAYMTLHILGDNILAGSMKEAADINGDGVIDVLDMSYIVSYLLGYIDSIPQRQVP